VLLPRLRVRSHARPPTRSHVLVAAGAALFLLLPAAAASAGVPSSDGTASVDLTPATVTSTVVTTATVIPAAVTTATMTPAIMTTASVTSAAATTAGAMSATVTTAGVSPAAVVVSPDPARDLYTGTGGLVVPAHAWRGDPTARGSVAGCTDCSWRISVLCTKAEAAVGQCWIIHLGCPVDTTAVRIWLQHGSGPWEVVGEACQGPTPPHTIGDVGASVRDVAQAALPRLRAAVQPADGVLVGIPAVFATGQPAGGIRGADLSVLDLAVTLDARVRWQWVYGDGASGWTSRPGGPWPDTSVSHVYRRSGRVSAAVQAVWRASYVVEGLGPFVVPGPLLTQEQSLPVLVRTAHAHLVS
jgi:hypothetical protein